LRSFAGTGGSTALYTLGENLHLLRDFGDDPQKLVKAAGVLAGSAGRSSNVLDDPASDLGDIISAGGPQEESEADQVHAPMTANALKLILQHLSGVPGRKNLIWLMEDPRRVPPVTMAMARQVNVVVYPVLLRLVGSGFGPDASCMGSPNTGIARDLAEVTGGRAFFDVMDLGFAVKAAQEDLSDAYVLGFYPPEETLDGRYHKITVKIRNSALQKHEGEIHYRPGYIASKAAAVSPAPSLAALFSSPFDSAGIGLTAQATPEPDHPGRYDLRVIVDLHDIHLEHKDGHFTGVFDLSVLNPSGKAGVATGALTVDVPDERLVEALARGFVVQVTGAEPDSSEIRVVVRDRSTGMAGSLRIPAKAATAGAAAPGAF
jgi:VWFA-related protein